MDGDVLRKLLVKMENQVQKPSPTQTQSFDKQQVTEEMPIKVRPRASRRAVKKEQDKVEVEYKASKVGE
jgi:hypothetical protein